MTFGGSIGLAALTALSLSLVPLPVAAAPAGGSSPDALAARIGAQGVSLASLVGSDTDSFVILSPSLSGLLTGQPTTLPPVALKIAGMLAQGSETEFGIPASGSAELGPLDFAGWFGGVIAEASDTPPSKPIAAHGKKPVKPAPDHSLYLLSSSDDSAAQAEVASVASSWGWHPVKGARFPLFVSPSPKKPAYLAAGKGVVAVSDSRPWLERVLARAASRPVGGHPLARYAAFRSTLCRLPADALAFAYVNLKSVRASNFKLHVAKAPKVAKKLDALAFLDALDAAAASIRTDPDGVLVDTEVHFDPKGMTFPPIGPALDPTALSAVSEGAVGFMSFSLPHDLMKSVFSNKAVPHIPGLSARTFSWLRGDMNLVVMPSGEASPSWPVSAYLALRTPDLAGARATLADLSALASIVMTDKKGRPTGEFEPATIGGADWSLWHEASEATASDATASEATRFEAGALGGYGFGARDLFVALGDTAVTAAASHSAITEDPDFQVVFRHLPVPTSAVAYIDVGKVLDLGLGQDLASGSAQFGSAIGTFRKYVKAVGFGSDSPWMDKDGFAHGVVFVRLADGWNN